MPLPFAALIPLLAAGVSAGGAIGGAAIQRGQSKRDIADQNAYNHPARQLARLREAGLPYAAYAAGQAGNQSALPITNDGGASQAGQHIAQGLNNYITTQAQLKQIDILKAETRQRNADADLKEAERDYLLSLRGEDRAGTNLTRNMATQYEYSQAQTKGQQVANRIAEITEEYVRPKSELELRKQIVEITNMMKNSGLIDEQIKGASLENKIKSVVAAYQPGMSEQSFLKLMKENDLLDENIDISKSEGRIRHIMANIEENTEGSKTMKIGAEAALSSLTWERVQEEFTNYKQYQEFVQGVQDYMNSNPWKGGPWKTFKEYWKFVIKFVYTSVTGADGNSSNSLRLLNNLPK